MLHSTPLTVLMGGFVPLSGFKLHLIWGDSHEHHPQTWTLRSSVWSHTYFLEFSQAICRQKQDIETHVSWLIYLNLKWFLTLPSSIIFPCRIQGCRESWKSKQISQIWLNHFKKRNEEKPKLCCPHPVEKLQQRVKQAAALEASSCGSGGSGRPCEAGLSSFLFSPSYTSRTITCFGRTGGSGTIVPPYLRHTDVSLFSLSKRPIVFCHAGWLLLSSGPNTHILTHTHTSFYAWKCSSFPTKT